MNNPYETLDAKVKAIWKRMAGDRALRISDLKAQREITALIAGSFDEINSPEICREIGFHLTDWASDAAFLIALHLYPEEFTPKEIEAGIGCFLVHAPSHVFAAAKLSGNSVDDITVFGDSEVLNLNTQQRRIDMTPSR